MILDASGELPMPRRELGRIVRESWVRWAEMQPNPKPSWLVPYDELCEADRDADDMIGESVARATLLALAAKNGSPANDGVFGRLEAALRAIAEERPALCWCQTISGVRCVSQPQCVKARAALDAVNRGN